MAKKKMKRNQWVLIIAVIAVIALIGYGSKDIGSFNFLQDGDYVDDQGGQLLLSR